MFHQRVVFQSEDRIYWLNMKNKIDFVITWVDGSDENWLKSKRKYEQENSEKRLAKWNDGASRYRDWELLKYWFRGVEKFAPWVNRVFFVTEGHIPRWLNFNHPKIKVVKHSDFIPQEYLPTFSSHTIELNFHRIEELSENFVYFNDDMYLVSNVNEEDFFVNNLPCDCAVINPVQMKQNGIRAEINNMYVINEFFDKNSVVKANFSKWFSPKYGKLLIRTLLMMPYSDFVGFMITHMPVSYLKSTFKEVWSKVPDIMEDTCMHRFRTTTDVNQWLMQFWQYATGNFIPRTPKIGAMYEGEDTIRGMCRDITGQKYKIICFNDAIDIVDFEEKKKTVQSAFDSILQAQSEFEI